MKIKVFQIDSDLDRFQSKFLSHESAVKRSGRIDPSIYKTVFSGDVDCKNLEDVYALFNTDHPVSHQGHSLSVSDVVYIDPEAVPKTVGEITVHNSRADVKLRFDDYLAYLSKMDELRERDVDFEGHDCTGLDIPMYDSGCFYCDSIGFKKLEDFDTEKCAPLKGHRMLVIEPGKHPYEAVIGGNYEDLVHAVGGGIECTYPFDDNAFIISNETSKIDGLPGNRHVNGGIYAGNMLIVGDDGAGGTTDLTDEQIRKYTDMFYEPEDISDEDVQNDMWFRIISF